MKKFLSEDFEYLYAQNLNWESLKGKKILVTGGTGLIGSLLLKFLGFLRQEKGFEIQLITLVRNERKAKCILGDMELELVVADISDGVEIQKKLGSVAGVDYIFHCAAITKSREMVEHPVEVFESIVTGTDKILQYAKEIMVESMVYLSSMEVYGQPFSKGEEETILVTENMTGYIDELQCRSCYPLGKKMAENLCYSYHKEYGVPVKIARLAQTFGAGVLAEDNRVFAQFANSAKEGKDIVLHTDGTSRGNYCYTIDAIYGLFCLLLCGENGQAYNVTNEEESRTIQEMAYLVADKIADGKIKVVFDIPKENIHGYAPKANIKLSGEKLRSLGWTPKYNMIDMYKRMMEE